MKLYQEEFHEMDGPGALLSDNKERKREREGERERDKARWTLARGRRKTRRGFSRLRHCREHCGCETLSGNVSRDGWALRPLLR